jgi:lysophospholipase L1-like esterase
VNENQKGADKEKILRIVPVAYRIHLLVPLLLALDVLLSWRQQSPGVMEISVLLFCTLWIVAGVFAFELSSKRKQFQEKFTGPLLAFFAVLLTLGAVEAGLRLAGTGIHRGIWKPGVIQVSDRDPPQFPGVSGPAKFTANEDGVRGPALPPGNGTYKIIAVGGSTTLCFALDDAREWPHLLMEGLNAQQKNVPVWVGNAGVSGHTAAHHLLLLRNVPVLSQVNMLIFLIGINDLQATWSLEGRATEGTVELDAEDFLSKIGLGVRKPFPLYKRLRLYELLRGARQLAVSIAERADTQGPAWHDRRRARRAAGPVVSAPDLHVGLQEYAARIQGIAEECRRRGLRCLFLTQPSMWREDLPAAEQKLLWFGWEGPIHKPKGFIPLRDLVNGLDGFNRVLVDTCARLNLECFDLAAVVPKDLSAFYDDVHLNDGGARIAASNLVHYLLSRAPLSNPAPSKTAE